MTEVKSIRRSLAYFGPNSRHSEEAVGRPRAEIWCEMYQIVRREQFSDTTFLWDVKAPDVAASAEPGHFVMLRLYDGASAFRSPSPTTTATRAS